MLNSEDGLERHLAELRASQSSHRSCDPNAKKLKGRALGKKKLLACYAPIRESIMRMTPWAEGPR